MVKKSTVIEKDGVPPPKSMVISFLSFQNVNNKHKTPKSLKIEPTTDVREMPAPTIW